MATCGSSWRMRVRHGVQGNLRSFTCGSGTAGLIANTGAGARLRQWRAPPKSAGSKGTVDRTRSIVRLSFHDPREPENLGSNLQFGPLRRAAVDLKPDLVAITVKVNDPAGAREFRHVAHREN